MLNNVRSYLVKKYICSLCFMVGFFWGGREGGVLFVLEVTIECSIYIYKVSFSTRFPLMLLGFWYFQLRIKITQTGLYPKYSYRTDHLDFRRTSCVWGVFSVFFPVFFFFFILSSNFIRQNIKREKL